MILVLPVVFETEKLQMEQQQQLQQRQVRQEHSSPLPWPCRFGSGHYTSSQVPPVEGALGAVCDRVFIPLDALVGCSQWDAPADSQ